MQRSVGGSEPAAQCSRRGILDDIGDCDQIGVSSMQGHILGEGTPVGEAGLPLAFADLVVAAGTWSNLSGPVGSLVETTRSTSLSCRRR